MITIASLHLRLTPSPLRRFAPSLLLALLLASCTQTSNQQNTEATPATTASTRDTCDNPDANIECSFIHAPKNLTGVITIADADEPGERMVISGTLFKKDGKTPYPDVVIYVYHTDATGEYTKKGDEVGVHTWHGHLHGWGKSNQDGRYEIRSIRPAPYPSNTMPAHIHAVIKEPNGGIPYYINDFVFADDSHVNERYLSSLRLSGGNGVVELKRLEDGNWGGYRDIVLMENSQR